jgi:putative toxin-antitoxin system antitoxin component (TIGR02293 family)
MNVRVGPTSTGVSRMQGDDQSGMHPGPIHYDHRQGINAFVARLRVATPMELIEAERHGVAPGFLRDLADYLAIPLQRLLQMVGLQESSLRLMKGPIQDSAGQAAIRIADLIATAHDLVAASTAADEDFDTAKWLGHWLRLPQPSLGGRQPCELLDTPTGAHTVKRLLGALSSGSYV